MGVLIKGTIQVQDAESVVAQNTGVQASNTNYIDQYSTTAVQGTNEQALAVSIENALNDKLQDPNTWSLFSITTVYTSGTNPHWAYITWIRLKTNWV